MIFSLSDVPSYPRHFQESLRAALQEKVEAVQKLADVEVSLVTVKFSVGLLTSS